MALAWAADLKDSPDSLADVLDASLKAARADQQEGETFWNTVTEPDIHLLRTLVDQQLDADSVSQILADYQACLRKSGDRNKHDSVVRQLEFLCLAARRLNKDNEEKHLKMLLNELTNKENS